MRACRAASVLGFAALVGLSALASCRDAERPEVLPVTTARPGAVARVVSPEGLGANPVAAREDAGAMGVASTPSPVTAKFVDTPATLEAAPCKRVLVAVVKGKVAALDEALSAGDVLVIAHGAAFQATGAGTVVWAQVDLGGECVALPRPAVVKRVIRATAAPALRWAGGTMSAHLDVPTNPPKAAGATVRPPPVSPSPELYLGRLEGSASVPEHTHAASWEILAAVDANGTFVVDGAEGHLGPRQIVMVPPGVKHAWRPAAGSKLVAIQMYSPPGPEQRFVGLAAVAKDAGAAATGAGARHPR